MPLRARSGSPWGRISSAIPLLAAAAAPTAAAATARYARVHHGIGREGGGAGGYRGEVGDHTSGGAGAALGTLSDVVSGAHRAHEIEALPALGALVLVEGHLSHLSLGSRSGEHCTSPPALKNRARARKLNCRFRRGRSSVGRAPPLHGGGQGFESPRLHSKKVVDLQTKYAKCGAKLEKSRLPLYQ